MADNRPIGILDSGSGGLSVRQSIRTLMPGESTIYVGDHANIPYSSKSGEFIRERIGIILSFLAEKHAKLAVIACNTATVAGIDAYRERFPDMPIVGVVPVVKTAARLSAKKNFAVVSTAFTAASDYQKRLIAEYAPDCTVHNLGSSTLVGLVEAGETDTPETRQAIAHILTPDIARQIDVLALGCTHYPFLVPAFRAVVGDAVTIIDSGEAVARQVHRILETNGSLADNAQPVHSFYTTGDPGLVSRTAAILIPGASPVVERAPFA